MKSLEIKSKLEKTRPNLIEKYKAEYKLNITALLRFNLKMHMTVSLGFDLDWLKLRNNYQNGHILLVIIFCNLITEYMKSIIIERSNRAPLLDHIVNSLHQRSLPQVEFRI